ncbi:endonuclease/exonuclease/phosphatase family protein [Deinococcus sp. YIM 134068]|uniref:endonuclease/exonuclease/phosphatase family protein n=1 Tax=Deinococcus lichenicola TaxID=3118910 RepID=UPI002F923BA6
MRLAVLYLLTVVLAWLLGEFIGEWTVPTLLLAYVPAVVWLVPAPFVLLWTLWRRRGVGVALVATLLAAWGAGLLHWRPHQQGGSLRVVTFNVARGTLGGPERVASILRAADADVILLQETNFIPAGYRRTLLTALPGYHVGTGYEVMTLSRSPQLSNRNHAIPGSRRTVLETAVSWRGQRLRLVNAHLNTVLVSNALKGDLNAIQRTSQARVWQIGLLCRLASANSGPLLLGGDLNTPPRGRLSRRLHTCVGQNAHDLAGRGPGWTFPGLFLRIDHLFSRGLTPSRARVLPASGSDHRPLLVEYP